MGPIDTLSNGWRLTKTSFKVLRENKQLIIFPILSGISLVLLTGSFVLAVFAGYGFSFENIQQASNFSWTLVVLSSYVFYLINYFVIIFFNIALIHCTRLYFRGEEVSIQKGLQFSMTRIGAILKWSLVAATIGFALRSIQENSGVVGKIIAGLVGFVWAIATFFVMPVIAYENVGPREAFKRSAEIMKKQWGESLVANFSFSLVQLVAVIVVSAPLVYLGSLIHPIAGVALGLIGAFVITAVISASQTIFISAVYHHVNGDPVKHFNENFANNLFNEKN